MAAVSTSWRACIHVCVNVTRTPKHTYTERKNGRLHVNSWYCLWGHPCLSYFHNPYYHLSSCFIIIIRFQNWLTSSFSPHFWFVLIVFSDEDDDDDLEERLEVWNRHQLSGWFLVWRRWWFRRKVWGVKQTPTFRVVLGVMKMMMMI